jgi:hypothetical protein
MHDALESLSREQLFDEGKRLRAGTRAHRDASGHGLCWTNGPVGATQRPRVR